MRTSAVRKGLFQISEAIEPGFASEDSFDNGVNILGSLGQERVTVSH